MTRQLHKRKSLGGYNARLVGPNNIFSLAEGFLKRPDLEPRMLAIVARGSGTVVLVMDVPQRAQPEVEVDGKIWALSLEDGELYVDRQADSPLLLRISTNSGVSPQHLDLVVTVATAEDGSVVEVFADPEDEGEQYLGSATLSGGQWELFITVPTELNLTATITDLQGNTSAFPTPPPAP